MKFDIEEIRIRIQSGNRSFYFKVPDNYYSLYPQPNNLSIRDRLSIHEKFMNILQINTSTVCINFQPTSETDDELINFIAECIALCEFEK